MIYPADALLMAPLSGFTDAPFRRSVRHCGCRYAFTEMADAASLVYAPDRASGVLRRYPDEDFLGVQLLGGDPELIRRAVRFINTKEFDVIDFNLGCPVPKVAKKCAGAELARDYDQAMACFSALAENSRFPVTAKLRILDENDPEPTLRLCRGLAGAGAQAITIHGRIKERYYSGPVHFPVIRAVHEELEPQVAIIANGGVNSLEKYREIRRETGCSRVMLATGAMGNPWLFARLSDPEHSTEPTGEEWRAMIEEQTFGMIGIYGEESTFRRARKVYHDYLKGRGFPGALRAMASGTSSAADLKAWLDVALNCRVFQ